jgi:hypothetical protein
MAKKKPIPKPIQKPEAEEPVEEQSAPEPPKPDKEEKPEKKRRYEVALAKEKEPNCYVTFKKTDNFTEAKNACIDMACDEERECVVIDNETWDYPFVFRHKPGVEVKDEPVEEPKKIKRGR